MRASSKTITWILLLWALAALSGCATVQLQASASPHPDRQAVWCVLTPVNNTSTPYAGGRVQQQLVALLGVRGLTHVLLAPPLGGGGPLPVGEGAQEQQRQRLWARRHGARYGLIGSVDEWHYKIGLDGQPALGVTLRLTDLRTGKTLWSGVASATGTSREGLAVLSERTLAGLLKRLLP
jgi:hypothetical protein